MIDLLKKAHSVGKRLAEAGRQARSASATATGVVTEEVTRAIGAAAGEVVRAAVIGAVEAVVRPPHKLGKAFHQPEFDDDWDDEERFATAETSEEVQLEPNSEDTLPCQAMNWAAATRAVGTVLTVAAGAAASVPGGRLVATGLGAVAAVATLAARAGENTSS